MNFVSADFTSQSELSPFNCLYYIVMFILVETTKIYLWWKYGEHAWQSEGYR